MKLTLVYVYLRFSLCFRVPISSISSKPSPLSTSPALTFVSANPSSSLTSTSSPSISTSTFASFLTPLFTSLAGQILFSASAQFSHFLPCGKHTVCPNPTNNPFISCHLSLGNQLSRHFLVSSGFFVFFPCQFHKFVMRCTCTSTPIPSCL